ncbi:MAG TPA: nuclear transport factor 2 family protein [Candidatus Limnocylindrales bacterium]|nr:nuclear transport factor 2 family protein [Candidatus Limnocylindrales bacterium]
MKRSVIVAFLLSASAFAQVAPRKSATPLPHRQKTAAQDIMEKQLRDADLAFAQATAERRIEGWMEFFAEDGAIIREGKILTGKQAIRQFYEPVFANRDFTLSWVPTKAEVSKDGTLGYTYGDAEAKVGAVTSRGMYVTVWRRINGKWKVVLDLGSQPRQQPEKAHANNNP